MQLTVQRHIDEEMLSNQMKPITIRWGMMAEMKDTVDLHKIDMVVKNRILYVVANSVSRRATFEHSYLNLLFHHRHPRIKERQKIPRCDKHIVNRNRNTNTWSKNKDKDKQ